MFDTLILYSFNFVIVFMKRKLDSILDYHKRSKLVLDELNNSIISGFYKNRILESLNGGNRENLIHRGTSEIYRVGILNEASLVLRVPCKFYYSRLVSKVEVENFCLSNEVVFNKGHNVTSFCLPVIYDLEGDDNFALLCEDLTDWGRFGLEDFILEGEVTASRYIKTKVDLDANMCGEFYVDLGSRSFPSSLRLLTDNKFTDSDWVLDLR